MSDDREKQYLKFLLDLIPDDSTSPSAEERMDTLIGDFSPIPRDLSLDHEGSLVPVDKQLVDDMQYNEDFSILDENDGTFSDIPYTTVIDKCSLELDASPENDKVPVNNDETFIETKNLADLVTLEILQVPCLQSIEVLKKICQEMCVKFNDYSDNGVLPSRNSEPYKGTSNIRTMEFQIPCLYNMANLRQMCEDHGLIFSNSYSSYSVDMIFTHKVIGEERYYYIKWKKLPTEENTWEAESDLIGCRDIINFYYAMKYPRVAIDMPLLRHFVEVLTSREPYDIRTLTKVCALMLNSSEIIVQRLNLTISQMRKKVSELLNFTPNELRQINNRLCQIMHYGEARKRMLINLEEWQKEINLKYGAPYIEVENNVDLEIAPSNFEFINDYINTVIAIPEEPVTFCECKDCFKEKKSCCPHDSEGHFAYDKDQRLILKPGYPIFECNWKCHCDSSCINRVVQHGQKIKVAIFRTSNNCGWGLKTLETIEKGQFVLEYLGEIITSEAAEARGNIYDYTGRSYLFDMCYGVDNGSGSFTIDAGHVGNASHFINHSCDPNLHVFAVWINQPDPRLPRLAFFSKRKIIIGEELTFDYQMVQKDYLGRKYPVTEEQERILCLCNSKICRKYLF